MQHVIIQRRLPTYDFLVTTSVSPELAAAFLERSLSETGNFVRRSAEATSRADRPAAVRLAPRHFWSPQPCVTVRINPSVGGSNVHVSLSTQPTWWVILLSLFALFLLTVSWAYTLRGVPLGMLIVLLGMLIVFAGLIAAIGTMVWAIGREASIAVAAVGAADIQTI
ncbi:MAG TPA: hypothetical protein VNN08_18060 [Thermoanaerobaculia bacterium]|nr:hypothetical protein [Thermoanaerobaculia bacterium]